MTVPRTVSEVLAEHVEFEIESIDRMNVFVPELQRTGQVVGFLMRHRRRGDGRVLGKTRPSVRWLGYRRANIASCA
jgi:hypothetical protein